jgi:hypothetical protein
MKSISHTLTTFSMMLATTLVLGQSAEKIVIKSFNTSGQSVINLNLPGNAEVKIGDHETVRIQITIQLASGNAGMLDELIKVGRYNLTATSSDGQFNVISPNSARKITVKGQELKETLSYIITVPKNLTVLINGQPSAGNETASTIKH